MLLFQKEGFPIIEHRINSPQHEHFELSLEAIPRCPLYQGNQGREPPPPLEKLWDLLHNSRWQNYVKEDTDSSHCIDELPKARTCCWDCKIWPALILLLILEKKHGIVTDECPYTILLLRRSFIPVIFV